ncbi:MAG: hypothetical protein IKT58_06150, partial [Oscillospiraceae bacterium]|nr:hypothetical protein [Oscillospiraceae bacterium]
MLDELCVVCRDLLILGTVPSGGSAMVSGICTQAELGELRKLFSSGELLRMTSILRDTVSGFQGSANRRIDAELCLIRLCEPEAELDAQSLNARLTRLENKIAGGLICAPVPQGVEVQASEPVEPSLSETAPAVEEAPLAPVDESPVGFWPRLVEQLRTQLRPPAVGMFVVHDNAPVVGRLRGNILDLEAGALFAFEQVNKPQVLQVVAECASGILGRPIRVRVVRPGEVPVNNVNFDRLMQFAREHEDTVDVM